VWALVEARTRCCHHRRTGDALRVLVSRTDGRRTARYRCAFALASCTPAFDAHRDRGMAAVPAQAAVPVRILDAGLAPAERGGALRALVSRTGGGATRVIDTRNRVGRARSRVNDASPQI
jgi:hypothetical protein